MIAEKPMANETIPASCMAGANVDVSWDEERRSAAAIAQANPARSEKLGRADRIAQYGNWLAFRSARAASPTIRIFVMAYASRPSSPVGLGIKNRFWK